MKKKTDMKEVIQKLKADKKETLQKIKQGKEKIVKNQTNAVKIIKALKEFSENEKNTFLTDAEKEINEIFSKPSRNSFIASLTMKKETINWLDNMRNEIIQTLTKLNSRWIREYYDLHQNNLKEQTYLKQQIGILRGISIPSEKQHFIKEIKKKKDKLRQEKPGKKISISDVAREFEKKDSTFRGWLQNHKISKDEFDKI